MTTSAAAMPKTAFGWYELMTTDVAAATAFYTTVVGWSAQDSGMPGTPRVFITGPGQGINIAMNTWHGVLTPLEADADFLCIDRGGEGNNLEEHVFPEPWTIQAT